MVAPNSPNHVVNCRMKDSFIEQAEKKKRTSISSVLKIKILTIMMYTFNRLNKTLIFLFLVQGSEEIEYLETN